MIEAIKDYLYYEEGNKENFSIIQVFPYLTSGFTEEELDSDLSEVFNFTHQTEGASFIIHVRSKEAVSEVERVLISSGFDVVSENSNEKLYGMANCCRSMFDESGNDVSRRYYSLTGNDLDKSMLSKSNLSVSLKFPMTCSNLVKFKKVIHELSEKLDYRNMWSLDIDRTRFVIK